MAFERQNIDVALDWDATIEKDSAEFEILPEGDYLFMVEGFERARHPGSEKLPPCNKAIINLVLSSYDSSIEGRMKHNLFLHSKCEGLLCSFFASIGLRKKGEKLQMDWSKVTGAQGRCKVTQRKYTKNTGGEGVSNEIKKFYAPDEADEGMKKQTSAGNPAGGGWSM